MDTADSEGTQVEWLPLREAAQRVGRSTKTIRRQAKAGQLVAQRAGDSETSPWLVSSVSLADVYGGTIATAAEATSEVIAEATADVVTALSAQLSDVTAMLNDANRIAREAVERAAISETTAAHLRERLQELREANERPTRWWRR